MYYRIKQLILGSGDLAGFFAGLYLALFIRFGYLSSKELQLLLGPMVILFGAATVIYFIIGLYDVGRARNTWEFYQKILLSASVWLVTSIIFFYVNPLTRATPKSILLLTTLCSFGVSALWRALYNHFLSTAILKTNVIFVGHRPEVTKLIELLTAQPERGFAVAGLITTTPISHDIPNLITGSSLESILNKNHLSRPGLVVVSPEISAESGITKELYQLLFKQVSVISLANFYENMFGCVPPFTFSENWFITNLNRPSSRAYARFRILADWLIALGMATFFAATFPLIALAIKLNSRGPIFFKQTRIGQLGKSFVLYKYRTMRSLNIDGSAELSGPEFASVADKRVTFVGKFLRRSRLDELPQCVNILRGQMALIGPRPERPEFVAQLTQAMPFYTLRHLIKPGLTGWAQLQHSYYGTIEENLFKLQYDLYYLKNRSPILDLVITLRTFNILLRFMGR